MYNDFASVYDSLMGDVDYIKRCEVLMSLFRKYGNIPTLMLDLACGTGGFSNAFASHGISVIGVDISPEMLARARENSALLGNDILYLCQDAAELDLYGTVDGAVCCLDSLNHITDYDRLCMAINKVSLFLEQGSLFVFDVNTLYKHENVLGNNTFVLDEDSAYCVWCNEYDADTHTTDIFLDFFVPCKDGRYERTSEEFSERAYTHTELTYALENAGLKLIAVCGENGEEEISPTAERVIYICRKV